MGGITTLKPATLREEQRTSAKPVFDIKFRRSGPETASCQGQAANWNDLVDFEVYPAVTSKQAAEKTARDGSYYRNLTFYFAGFAKAASSMAALFLISENLRIMVESGDRCSMVNGSFSPSTSR